MSLAETFQGALFAAIILAATAYVSYMIGLIMVLRRLNKMSWQAFVPILNYHAQVRAVGAPTRWFLLSLIPYFGAIYAGSVAIRLGAIFGKGTAFSLFWLTFGAGVGMPIIARSETLDKDLHRQPIKLLDVRAIRKKLRRSKTRKAPSGRTFVRR